MVLYFSRVYTATVIGRTLKQVTCEHCGTQFSYELARAASGEGHAPYMIGTRSAQNSAETSARRNLDKRLAAETELVPCPSCRWVNESAIRAYRASRCRSWIFGPIVLLTLAAITNFTIYSNAQSILGRPASLLAPPILAISGIALFLSALFYLWQRIHRLRIQPNIGPGIEPRVPPGTPPALLLDPTSDTWRVIPSSPLQDPQGTVAFFRVGQLQLPTLCSPCLGPAERLYQHPTTFGNFSVAGRDTVLHVPVCKRCMLKLRLRWWAAAFATALVTSGVGWLLSRLHFPRDPSSRSMMVFVYFVPLLLASLAVVDYLLKPYRLRMVDPHRGVARISFANPAYTALVIRAITKTEESQYAPDPPSPAIMANNHASEACEDIARKTFRPHLEGPRASQL